MIVPATTDVIQKVCGKLEMPEIRVWVHPKLGSDDFVTFVSFGTALAFIKEHPEAERVPLLAFRGYELNLWEMHTEEEIEVPVGTA